MSKFAEQLAQYRAKKHAERHQSWQNVSISDAGNPPTTTQNGRTTEKSMIHQWIDSMFLNAKNTRIRRIIESSGTIIFLKVLLWVLLFSLFVHLQFGAIFFMASIFYLMYATMNHGRKRQVGELSAYSVFNPGLERIDGTFTTEQFERELLRGSGSIR